MSRSSAENSVLGPQTVIVAALLAGFLLAFVLRRLQRTRPEFDVGMPLTVGVGLRLMAAAGVSATGLNTTLRGGDEETYLFWANRLADSPIGQGFIPHDPYQLHIVLLGLEIKYGNFSEGAMRVGQIGIAMLGVLFLLAAVYDMAGPRASVLTAWLLAFEPASLFFNSGLSKEPMMVLAGGLVVFGGTKIWRQLELSGLLVIGLGCLIALTTRPYAGWFMISAAALLILHAGLRRLDRPLKAMPLVYGVVLAGFLTAPTLIQATSEEKLQRLQVSQDFSTREGAQRRSTGANSDNLALERVDFSTREAVLSNLPKRMLDVVTRPHPWQLGNANQQLGAAGSLVAFGTLLLLIVMFWEWRGRVMSVVAPFMYPTIFLLMAYSLSAGNAGTGFRYRTHLVMIGVAMLVALREHPERHLRKRQIAGPDNRVTPHSDRRRPAPAAG